MAGHDPLVPLPWPILNNRSRALLEGTVTLVVGCPGTGKSMFTIQIKLFLELQKVEWADLLLEDDAQHFLRRAAAQLEDDFAVIEDPQRAAAALETNSAMLRNLEKHIVDNPRRPERGPDGLIHVTPITAGPVLQWSERVLRNHRVAFIDSLAMLGFNDREQWRGEAALIGDLVAVARETKGSIVLVCHTVKIPNKKGGLGLGDVQGAAALTREAHTILLMEGHERKCSYINPGNGDDPHDLWHTRTITIGKARNGSGSGLRLAYEFGKGGSPRFEEIGLTTKRP